MSVCFNLKRYRWAGLVLALMSCGSQDGELASEMEDDVSLIDGLEYQVLLSWGDPISDLHFFGYDNDQLTFLNNAEQPRLWVSHEDVNTMFVSGYELKWSDVRHMDQIRKELYQVGASVITLDKGWKEWKVVKESQNARITGATQIGFEWPEPIAGSNYAFGTVASGAGSLTPWGTVLVAEGDYSRFYGDKNYEDTVYQASDYQWESFLSKPTKHYGWVVEVNPEKGTAVKHVALGRMTHESAFLTELIDGRVVIYTSDHARKGYLYKFVSDLPGQIYPGRLFVANFTNGSWNELDYQYKQLNDVFPSATDMMIHSSKAAAIIGGTRLAYPAGVAIDPATGDVLVAVEGKADELFGSILRIKEGNGEYDALKFKSEVFIDQSDEMVRPHELKFDKAGNLWITSNVKPDLLGKAPFETVRRNVLYVLDKMTGKITLVALAPYDATFGGMCFDDKNESLFLSVKHPGAVSSGSNYTSSWPGGEGTTPKPSVIVITGKFLNKIMSD